MDSSSRPFMTYKNIETLGSTGPAVKLATPAATSSSLSRGIRIGPAQIFWGYWNTRSLTWTRAMPISRISVKINSTRPFETKGSWGYHMPPKPPPPPRSAQSRSGSEDAHTTEPSYLTTLASNMLIGSEIHPYSLESHENPPLIMVPATPTQGVRAPTTVSSAKPYISRLK